MFSSGTGADWAPSLLNVHNSPLPTLTSCPRRRRVICVRRRSLSKVEGAVVDFVLVGGRMKILYGI